MVEMFGQNKMAHKFTIRTVSPSNSNWLNDAWYEMWEADQEGKWEHLDESIISFDSAYQEFIYGCFEIPSEYWE